jgi:hypothetical protein
MTDPLRLALGGPDLIHCPTCDQQTTATWVVLIDADGTPVCTRCARTHAPALQWCADALATLRGTLGQLDPDQRDQVLRGLATVAEEWTEGRTP